MVGRHHPNFPTAPKLFKDFLRDPRPNAPSPVTTDDEKLCHIPGRLKVGTRRRTLHQCKPRRHTVHGYEKWVPMRLAPVERKGFVREFTVFAYFDVNGFAEVIAIQLKQIR